MLGNKRVACFANMLSLDAKCLQLIYIYIYIYIILISLCVYLVTCIVIDMNIVGNMLGMMVKCFGN
jgi:hypothetical protein